MLDVQPPDENDRKDIFCIHLRNIPCSSDVSIKDLAQLTQGYTGADIKLVCREAAIAALEVCCFTLPYPLFVCIYRHACSTGELIELNKVHT